MKKFLGLTLLIITLLLCCSCGTSSPSLEGVYANSENLAEAKTFFEFIDDSTVNMYDTRHGYYADCPYQIAENQIIIDQIVYTLTDDYDSFIQFDETKTVALKVFSKTEYDTLDELATAEGRDDYFQLMTELGLIESEPEPELESEPEPEPEPEPELEPESNPIDTVGVHTSEAPYTGDCVFTLEELSGGDELFAALIQLSNETTQADAFDYLCHNYRFEVEYYDENNSGLVDMDEVRFMYIDYNNMQLTTEHVDTAGIESSGALTIIAAEGVDVQKSWLFNIMVGDSVDTVKQKFASVGVTNIIVTEDYVCGKCTIEDYGVWEFDCVLTDDNAVSFMIWSIL